MSGPTVRGFAKRSWYAQAWRWATSGLPTVAEVLAHYKSTWIGTQVFIGIITLVVLFKSGTVGAPIVFSATMQIGAVFGAIWAARLKNKIGRARSISRA